MHKCLDDADHCNVLWAKLCVTPSANGSGKNSGPYFLIPNHVINY